MKSLKKSLIMPGVLEEKKILLIAPGYHNYISIIASAFKKLGAYVEVFKSDPSTIFFRNFYLSRLKKFKIFDNYFENEVIKTNSKILKSLKGKNFDDIIIIKGRLLTEKFIIDLKELFHEANFILYQWDSVKNYNYLPKVKYFHKVYSFDYSDCELNKNIFYLPLFFSEEYSKIANIENIDFEYDLFFIGFNHSTRVQILNDIIKFCDKNSLRYSFHLMTTISEKLKLFLKGSKIKCYFNSLDFNQFSNRYIKSKAIIDISSPGQSGLTFRVIEAIGANKKIITTNFNVVKETFYDPKMIFIWGKDDLNKLNDFLNQGHEKKETEQYSAESFALNLLSGTKSFINSRA